MKLNGINKTINLSITILLGQKKIYANHAKEGKIKKQFPKKSTNSLSSIPNHPKASNTCWRPTFSMNMAQWECFPI